MPGKKARGFVQKESAPYLSSAALADNLPKMHEYQAEKEFVRTMMVLHRPLLLKKNKNALALKRLGLTLRQLVVLGVSKRAMEAAGINTAQLEPRWEPPAADNPRTAEAYRGKVDGTKVEGYAAYDAPVYHFRDERHIKERYIIAELPQYRTKAIPLHGRYRVRFRLNKDLTDSSRLIAGVVDRDVFRYFRNEKTWDRELYRDIYGLRCRKTPDRQGWSLTASGTPIYVQDPYAPFGKAGDIVDVIVDDAVPYPGYDDEFTRSCKTYINGKLRFEQVIDPYTLYWKLVPIVMAQDVDITLESVDELPTEGRLQAKGQLPTEGRLQAKGQLPTEGRLQAKGQLPTEGRLQAKGQLPTEGRLQAKGQLPTEGRLQAKGQLPTEGRLQAKGQLPTEGRLQAKGQLPTEGRLQAKGQLPTEGRLQAKGQLPTEGRLQAKGQLPTEGRLQAKGQLPTEGRLQAKGQLPTEGRLQAKGQLPTEGRLQAKGQLPTEGRLQAKGQLPTEGRLQAKGQLPTEGRLQAKGQLPTEGRLQAKGQLPTEGRLQAKGQLPTEGRLQAKGQLPTEGRLQAEGQLPTSARAPALRL